MARQPSPIEMRNFWNYTAQGMLFMRLHIEDCNNDGRIRCLKA
jgi:hypothetical protein